MTFTWSIQKVDFWPNQFEEKGQIEVEQAIIEFYNFPWEDQFTQLETQLMTLDYPTLIFSGEQEQKLSICAISPLEFVLVYEQGIKISEIEVQKANDFDKDVFIVEDYIRYFFEGTYEENVKVNFKPKLEHDQSKILDHYEFSFSKNKHFGFIGWNIIWLLANIIIVFIVSKKPLLDQNQIIAFLFQLTMAFYWLPALYLFFTYYIRNRNAQLKLNLKTQTFHYSDKNQDYLFTRSDIKFCLFSKTSNEKLPWSKLHHLRIDLKNGKSIWITCLFADPSQVVELMKLKYKMHFGFPSL